MSKPFSLQVVLELTQKRADAATQELAKLIANERDARNKLAMLQQYRNEYASRFQLAAQNGLAPSTWSNYQEFLNRLDDAIAAQMRAVAQQAGNTASGQAHWRQQQQKLKAIDTLSVRHKNDEEMRQQKLDQKTQDEFASRLKTTYRSEHE